jgi:hypothetical protein
MYSAIEHVARICSLTDWKRVNMAMLTAAFDCSQDGGRKYFIMAGFVSSTEEWAEFDREWRERLRRDGLPYFHMNPYSQSFSHPKKPFTKEWVGDKSRREALLGDLLSIIQHRAWRKFGCILPADSLQFFSDVARKNYLPTLIATAGRLIWPDLEIWRKQSGFREPARMVFEDGDEDKGSLIEAIKQITGRAPSFEFKKDDPQKGIVAFTPLQASDILAYEIQKMTGMEGRPLDEPFRFPYAQLEKLPGDIRMLRHGGAKVIDEFTRVVQFFDDNPLPKPTVQ